MSYKIEGPYADVIRPLTKEEFEQLKADIATNGVLVPIITDGKGNIVDGHHRKRAADMLGVAVPTIDKPSYTDEEYRKMALSLNWARRHLTLEEKRQLTSELLRARPESSDRSIGVEVGVDHKTVAAVRSSLAACGEIPHTEERLDARGNRWQKKTPQQRVEATVQEPPTQAGAPTKQSVDRSSEAVRQRRARIRELVEAGQTVKEIAHEIGINEKTVQNIARKLGLELATGTGREVAYLNGLKEQHQGLTRLADHMEGQIHVMELFAEIHSGHSTETIAEWVAKLSRSRRAMEALIKRLRSRIKEIEEQEP